MIGLNTAAVYVLQTLGSLYLLIVLLRFVLQLVRANFYNPLCQFAVKATQPLLKPLRRIIPSMFGLDMSSLVLAILVQLALMAMRIESILNRRVRRTASDRATEGGTRGRFSVAGADGVSTNGWFQSATDARVSESLACRSGYHRSAQGTRDGVRADAVSRRQVARVAGEARG